RTTSDLHPQTSATMPGTPRTSGEDHRSTLRAWWPPSGRRSPAATGRQHPGRPAGADAHLEAARRSSLAAAPRSPPPHTVARTAGRRTVDHPSPQAPAATPRVGERQPRLLLGHPLTGLWLREPRSRRVLIPPVGPP